MITHTAMTSMVVDQHRIELQRRAHQAQLIRQAVHAMSRRKPRRALAGPR